MIASLALVALGSYGVHLAYTARAHGWSGLGVTGRGRSAPARHVLDGVRTWLTQAGLNETSPAEFALAALLAGAIGATVTWVLFGGLVAAVIAGVASAAAPVAVFRTRREARRVTAQAAWPQMIEEIRILVGAAGRSIPQALFEVGARGPEPFRPAFAAAQREWLLSTDFDRTVDRLEHLLADPAADVTLETLLVAHRLGGADLDRRLAELAEDRRLEHLGRADAAAKQAGVRFARRFVLLVPLGMAAAGLSLGDGRSAYQAPAGQALVLVGLAMTGGCWWWSGRMLRLPDERRVFER